MNNKKRRNNVRNVNNIIPFGAWGERQDSLFDSWCRCWLVTSTHGLRCLQCISNSHRPDSHSLCNQKKRANYLFAGKSYITIVEFILGDREMFKFWWKESFIFWPFVNNERSFPPAGFSLKIWKFKLERKSPCISVIKINIMHFDLIESNHVI